MNIKRIVFILIGIMIIGFSVGLFSLIYNDDFNFSKIDLNHRIIVKDNYSNVRVGFDGIEVKDGDDQVIVGWDGIKVTDGDDQVIVGWDGIKVTDGDEKISIGKDGFDINGSKPNDWNWFGHKLENYSVDEVKKENIDNLDSIEISSSFVDVKVSSEVREDVQIKYYGKMKSNVLPKLETKISGNNLIIRLDNNKNSYTVAESNVVLEVFIPENYTGDFELNSSSADFYIDNIIATNFKLSTSSGNTTINKIRTNHINLNSSSGDILSKDVFGNVQVQTSSGDMRLFLSKDTGNYRLDSSSGDIEIYYDSFANYKGIYNTSSGDFEYDNSVNITKNIDDDKYEFSLGSGEKELKINTSSGDLDIFSIK
ncbi:DUF4097 family beta strand repeat-containing protein [Tissierella sp. Yu-01]|uniref:DUF4097 family beta strand repeat-containing protein n=1 Tax=Tissierella sp. Yu-01 TaxID=3035694 RepID=UPI00240E5E38|nr:DUF4097 family beta strand repeat-containing protein [Tissierella sp. Yu-01]WFA10233.1 DUF4097 family beta strand repeat-containing protein [Tissierella sp. Yu-01]